MKYSSCVALFTALMLTACSDEPSESISDESRAKIEVTSQERMVANAINSFGIRTATDYLAHLDSTPDNMVFSPLSSVSCLGMLLYGMDSDDSAECLAAMGIDETDADAFSSLMSKLCYGLEDADTKNKLNMANSLWIARGLNINAGFRTTISDLFDAEFNQTDFTTSTAKTEIDKWCSDKTNGMIRDVYEGSKDTKLCVVNAMLFDGSWSAPFDKSKTRKRPFTQIDGNKHDVEMMSGKLSAGYARLNGADLVGIPYYLGTYHCIIVMPDAGTAPAEYLSENASSIAKHLIIACPGEITVTMPKLDIKDTKTDLTRTLGRIGLGKLFTSNYPGISTNPLLLDAVHQHNAIMMDEDGTKAASVTISYLLSGAVSGGTPTYPDSIEINRPFAFFVVNYDTGIIVTMGIINRL